MDKVSSPKSVLDAFVSRSLGQRDFSVDALRGFAIMGMVLVNHGPPTSEIYSPLVHAPWIGWSFADTIFPIFLFLVGISIAYSGTPDGEDRRSISYVRVLRRTILLIAISIALVNFPYYSLDSLVLQGTLFRIAVCYFVAVLLYHWLSPRVLFATAVAILIAQWLLLAEFPVPGFGNGIFTVEGNASSYLDRLVFGPFADRFVLNAPVSQGLLPTAGAIATTLIGALTGLWLQRLPDNGTTSVLLVLVGCFFVGAGQLWQLAYPISKPLWTGSYVLLMTGVSMILLATLRTASRVSALKTVLRPLEVAGVNALFFYVLAQSGQRLLVYGKVTAPDGDTVRLRHLVFEQWFQPWIDGKAGALTYALTYLLLCYGVVWLLYRYRVFIKL